MAIAIRSNAGPDQAYAFNASRLDRVLHAQSLDEAQRMGLWDKIKDRFAGGVKAEAVRNLYLSVADPRSDQAQPTNLLHRFQRMKSALIEDPAHPFRVTVEGGLPETGDWSFSIGIGNITLHQQTNLRDGTPYSSVDFKRHLQAYELTDSFAAKAREADAAGGDEPLATRLAAARREFLDGLSQACGVQVRHDADPAAQDADILSAVTQSLRAEGHPILGRLNEVELGDTHLLALTWPDRTDDIQQLFRFDKAKTLITEELRKQLDHPSMQAVQAMINGREASSYVDQTLQCVSDVAEARGMLKTQLDDPFFSSANLVPGFRRLEAEQEGHEKAVFIATFEHHGERRELTFSDRSPAGGELRGDKLRQMMTEKTFSSLRELLLIPFGTRDDDAVASAAIGVSQNTESPAALQPGEFAVFLRDLQDTGPADIRDDCFKALAQVKVGKTNLLEAILGEHTPEDFIEQAADPRRGSSNSVVFV
jgi:hypothetical protein